MFSIKTHVVCTHNSKNVLHKKTTTNKCCSNSLEAPQWGNSIEYPQHMFLQRNKTKIILESSCTSPLVRCFIQIYECSLFSQSMAQMELWWLWDSTNTASVTQHIIMTETKVEKNRNSADHSRRYSLTLV